MAKMFREFLEKRKSSYAETVPSFAYYQPDFKRGEI